MPIQKVTRAGATVYKVQIRRRGFPSVFKTFERYSDAKAFEDRSLREQESRAAFGSNVNLTLGQVIDAYLASEEYAKLRSNRKGHNEHWWARLGTRKLTSLNLNVYQHEADLLAKGGRRPRSRATVASFMSALGTTLKYATRKLAADSRALAEFRCCTFSVQSGVRGRALEPEEVRRLVAVADVAKWPHWGLLVRLALKPEAGRVRRQTVEHAYGTLKSGMGATHFLTRTLHRVRTEMSLQVLAYNLKRVIQILGVQPLIAAIRAS
jgi:Transposase DDE domain